MSKLQAAAFSHALERGSVLLLDTPVLTARRPSGQLLRAIPAEERAMPRPLRIEYAGAIYHVFFGRLMGEWLCSTDWTLSDVSDRAKGAAAAAPTL